LESFDETSDQTYKADATIEEKEAAAAKRVVKKVSEECSRVTKSFAWTNTAKNRLIYDAFFGSEFSNPDWDKEQYETIIEFLAVQEFNQIRGKTFVEFS